MLNALFVGGGKQKLCIWSILEPQRLSFHWFRVFQTSSPSIPKFSFFSFQAICLCLLICIGLEWNGMEEEGKEKHVRHSLFLKGEKGKNCRQSQRPRMDFIKSHFLILLQHCFLYFLIKTLSYGTVSLKFFCKNSEYVSPNFTKPSAVLCSQPLSPMHAVSQAVLGSCPKKEREEAPNGWTSGRRRMGLGMGGGGGGDGTEFWATHN